MTTDNRPTIAEALYPSVGMQPEGKKIEPGVAAIPAATANAMGKGDYTPWDKLPPEVELVNWNEPPASSVTDYATALHLGKYQFERPAEFEQPPPLPTTHTRLKENDPTKSKSPGRTGAHLQRADARQVVGDQADNLGSKRGDGPLDPESADLSRDARHLVE